MSEGCFLLLINVSRARQDAGEDIAAQFGCVFFLIALTALFFLPAILAFRRSHRNRWMILLINLVFGATVLGWLFALIWAMNKIDDPIKGGTKHDSQPHDPTV